MTIALPRTVRSYVRSRLLRQWCRSRTFPSMIRSVVSAGLFPSRTCSIPSRRTACNYSTTAFERSKSPQTSEWTNDGVHKAYIAIGSNVGDRLALLDRACDEMSSRGIEVTRTSCLYETEPMYVLDQDLFLNGVCEVNTKLDPEELLRQLQSIETDLGRQKTVDKGPRNIDLDILLYGSERVDDGQRLSIPHKLMLERQFVLQPLCDLISEQYPPNEEGSKGRALSFAEALSSLPTAEAPLYPITPLSSCINLSSTKSTRSTHVMAILNITPDSFSDGGTHSADDLSAIAAKASRLIDEGATIFDVGGESTRPGATPITPEEELSRVMPVIEVLHRLPSASKMAISIDTHRAQVARAALDAGAHIINDVTGGTGDSAMLSTAAAFNVPIILMHNRGTPENMVKFAKYPNGVIETVGKELRERVDAAEKAGVRRWHIILDPGLGFAKGQAHNLELLRSLEELRRQPGLHGLPWLVGSSRKGFIGRVTGVKEAHQRTWGTAATITAAIQGGADIVRVHDVKEMAQVAKMSDAIWRREH